MTETAPSRPPPVPVASGVLHRADECHHPGPWDGLLLGAHSLEDRIHLIGTPDTPDLSQAHHRVLVHDLGHDSSSHLTFSRFLPVPAGTHPHPAWLQQAKQAHDQHKPALLLLIDGGTQDSRNPTLGWNLSELARQLITRIDCPIALIPPPRRQVEDLYTGYGSLVRATLGLVPWRQPTAERHTLSMVGHFFHRQEADQLANVTELRRLLEALGILQGHTFLAASSLKDLVKAHMSDTLYCLPYCGLTARQLAKQTGRITLEGGLPMGVAATLKWIREICAALAIDPRLELALSDREINRVTPRLNIARKKLNGKWIAIAADTPLAAAWTGLALELGLTVGLVVLLDRSLGGKRAFGDLLAWAGHNTPPDLQLVQRTTPDSPFASLPFPMKRNRQPMYDILVRPACLLEADSPWRQVPAVISGYPATGKHFTFAQPELGFNGAMAQAQRLLDAASGVH